MPTYTGVTNCQKTVRFFGPLCVFERIVIQFEDHCNHAVIIYARPKVPMHASTLLPNPPHLRLFTPIVVSAQFGPAPYVLWELNP